MFDRDSRYQNIDTASITTQDDSGQSRLCTYKRRRFLPRLAAQKLLYTHQVAEGDRLDNLAAQYAGDPVQYWRLCDANPTLSPEDLVATPGSSLLISMQQS